MEFENISISFDEEHNIRVLDEDKLRKTQQLGEQSLEFLKNIKDFHGTVSEVVQILDSLSRKLETEKLRAIGQRNKADSETKERERRKIALQMEIDERTAQLERYNEEYNSLQRIEMEQQAYLEKLSEA